jgi:ribosomal protein S18 acetylase RimI-like enzyme
MKKKYRELLEKFLAKNESDLEKMSRPRLQFPNLNVPTRLDQEIKPIGTERQKDIHARAVAETATRTAPQVQRIADPKRRQAVIESGRKDVVKQVKGSFGRGGTMGHIIPVAGKQYGAALVGKEYSKYDPALKEVAKQKEAAKLGEYKNKYDKWKQELQSKPQGSTDYWNHLANKPKEPRKSPIPKTDTKKLSPEAQIARGKAQEMITEHEAAHMAFGHIKDKYPKKYHGIMRHLMDSFSPEVRNSLIDATAKRYNPRSPHFYEEVVNHARDILVDKRMRDNFLRNTKGDQKLVSGVKQGWNEAVRRAKKLTPEFGKSELAKGAKGDWQKEGYKIGFHNDGKGTLFIKAFHPTEKDNFGDPEEVGHARIYNNSDSLAASEIAIHPDHRRKGLATAMYNLAELKTGKKIVRGTQYPDGKALWAQPNRPFGKSELEKGAQGDWKKEGYNISVHPYSDEDHLRIVAHDNDGNLVGQVDFSHDHEYPNILVDNAKVDKEHRRKGLASAMYSLAEKHSGKKIKQILGDENQTEDARNLWSQPNRPFSKSELNKAPKERLSGITTGKLKQLAEDHYHNPDTGLELVPEAVHQEIARRAENKAPKMIADYKRKLKPQKPSGENPEDWFGKTLNKALPTAPKVNLNPEHGKIIANAYENMKHDPNHPHVKAAYNALAHETGKQYQNLLNQGYKFSPMKRGMEDPYKTSKDMHADIANNKHLWYFPTEQGYGSEGDASSDHPLLAPSKFKDKNGNVMPHNDVFRAVHDIMGHHLGGQSSFGPKGEHQAYLTHKKTYSPLAQKALASETMGQNSYVTAGPNAAHNKANPHDTIYAEQKAGLLPDNIINGRWHE